ncbi:MAG: Bax inhibitor-1/YccA family protein [Planctomycetes bacterium]|nr:Bax inhibitor-1/YccA family protein [Planctomycetota bacterium]
MRTSNPALNAETFAQFGSITEADRTMTVQGTINKTAVLLVLLLCSAAFTWSMFYNLVHDLARQQADGAIRSAGSASFAAIRMWVIGGIIGGLVFGLITSFKPTAAPITAPLYALCEGLFIGAISAVFEAMMPGIVLQAVGLTFGTLAALLLAYKSGLVRATENFKAGVFAATGAICLIYLATFILSFFGISIPYIHGNGLIGIGFSLFVVGIAALNLVLDFDFIEQGARQGAPKYMEWYGGFGLMVTLVWLYIEILRLLSKLRSRD